MKFLLIIAVIGAVFFYLQRNKAKKELAATLYEESQKRQRSEQRFNELQMSHIRELDRLQLEIESLAPFVVVRDAEAEAKQIRQDAQALYDAATIKAKEMRDIAQCEIDELRKNFNVDAKTKRDRSEAVLGIANNQADKIIRDATQRAEQIAGDAYRALQEAEGLTSTATAMKNVIDGYGFRYLKPTYSLLDELAEAYGFDEAGQELKRAREHSRIIIEHERAAICDYVEKNRRETAIRFVIDAFNGKVDSILTRSKSDNFGTLERQIIDAFALVNYNGTAFRNARITDVYLSSRLSELKWAVAVHALREREKEEQRRIREQIREEEKARREINRALKEASHEEESLQKAVAKVQAQAATASESQRAEFDAKLKELQARLAEAENRNQRALSMAQQTKAGHVYVISNVGSFGEGMFKVGMTRRLEPLDRVRELGDASVPFKFDVHAMIWSNDAPGLERELHKRFIRDQVNKVNPRKEFFRVSHAVLREHFEDLGIESSWTMSADASEYRESLMIAQRLRDNPAAAEDWLRHQLDYDPAEELLLQTDETTVM